MTTARNSTIRVEAFNGNASQSGQQWLQSKNQSPIRNYNDEG
jgi:hypothetical protein